eukprot:810306-Pleurochrysis_carterae.AAC.1
MEMELEDDDELGVTAEELEEGGARETTDAPARWHVGPLSGLRQGGRASLALGPSLMTTPTTTAIAVHLNSSIL